MQNLTFDSNDLEATEEFLISAYSPMRIGNESARRSSASIRRDALGPVDVDLLDLGFDMRYSTEPLHRICLITVRSGVVEESDRRSGEQTFTQGDVGLLTPPDVPFSGIVRTASYNLTLFDPALLERVASVAEQPTPLRFEGNRPISRVAGRRLAHVIDHLQGFAADPFAADSELAAAAAADYLAITMLETMPISALLDPTATDRKDAHSDTLRRAVSYIESHLREDISVADIAGAAYVTTRALQLAFRRHLDTTPLAYLRKLRLQAAREDLAAADRNDGTTVTSVASEWGSPIRAGSPSPIATCTARRRTPRCAADPAIGLRTPASRRFRAKVSFSVLFAPDRVPGWTDRAGHPWKAGNSDRGPYPAGPMTPRIGSRRWRRDDRRNRHRRQIEQFPEPGRPLAGDRVGIDHTGASDAGQHRGADSA